MVKEESFFKNKLTSIKTSFECKQSFTKFNSDLSIEAELYELDENNECKLNTENKGVKFTYFVTGNTLTFTGKNNEGLKNSHSQNFEIRNDTLVFENLDLPSIEYTYYIPK